MEMAYKVRTVRPCFPGVRNETRNACAPRTDLNWKKWYDGPTRAIYCMHCAQYLDITTAPVNVFDLNSVHCRSEMYHRRKEKGLDTAHLTSHMVISTLMVLYGNAMNILFIEIGSHNNAVVPYCPPTAQ